MSYDYIIVDDFMRTKFIIFFSLIAAVMTLSTLNSWIIQAQFDGGVNLVRAAFQIALVVLILYALWQRAMAAFMLAVLYTVSVSLVYGYELCLYFLLGDISAKLPTRSVIINSLLIVATLLAVVLIGLDYADYRKRRK
jgi:hypothetical protein